MQYVVIATGWGKMETKSGNLYLAFSSAKKMPIRNYFTNLHNRRFKRIDCYHTILQDGPCLNKK